MNLIKLTNTYINTDNITWVEEIKDTLSETGEIITNEKPFAYRIHFTSKETLNVESKVFKEIVLHEFE